MNSSTIAHRELHIAIEDMTAATDLIEATFTPWDADQATELDALLREMRGLENLDAAIYRNAA